MPKLEITESKISKILKKLKPDKTPGPDGLHPRFFRELADCICIPLCLLFNKTLSLSVLPDAWKRARVSAIYKKENKKLACNYRPVSLTSIICKVMETLIRDHIVEHMKKIGCSLISNMASFLADLPLYSYLLSWIYGRKHWKMATLLIVFIWIFVRLSTSSHIEGCSVSWLPMVSQQKYVNGPEHFYMIGFKQSQ